MAWQFPYAPAGPDWRLDWESIVGSMPFLRGLAAVPQDPEWHAEGDVMTHTRMVVEALVADPEWRGLEPRDRDVTLAAALLHDIGKATTTTVEAGRIRSPKHTRVGQLLARQRLWYGDVGGPVGFAAREEIAALVRYHGLPLMFLEKPDPARAVITASMSLRCDLLAIVARADVLGRVCRDNRDMLARVEMFREFCCEQECFHGPKTFVSDHHRFMYFVGQKEYSYVPYDTTKCCVTLMSGLPATGKDHWIRYNAGDQPVISLDDLREEMGIDPGDGQGRVVDEAKDRARELLRRGQGFIWNATNISSEMRQQLIALFANYGARIRVVYTECQPEELFRRNRSRSRTVPADVIERLIGKLEVPTVTEAHELLVCT